MTQTAAEMMHDLATVDLTWAATKLIEADLIYAAYGRCRCGAGLAYRRIIRSDTDRVWACGDVLLGRAADVTHTDPLPFTFWEIKSENQPSAKGATTRPPEDAKARARRHAWDLEERKRSAGAAYNENREVLRRAQEQEAVLLAAIESAFAEAREFERKNPGVTTYRISDGVAEWCDFTPEVQP